MEPERKRRKERSHWCYRSTPVCMCLYVRLRLHFFYVFAYVNLCEAVSESETCACTNQKGLESEKVNFQSRCERDVARSDWCYRIVPISLCVCLCSWRGVLGVRVFCVCDSESQILEFVRIGRQDDIGEIRGFKEAQIDHAGGIEEVTRSEEMHISIRMRSSHLCPAVPS